MTNLQPLLERNGNLGAWGLSDEVLGDAVRYIGAEGAGITATVESAVHACTTKQHLGVREDGDDTRLEWSITPCTGGALVGGVNCNAKPLTQGRADRWSP